MPLLRKNGRELLLVHIPKCGGTSLEQVFAPDVQLTMFHSGPGELPCSPQHFQASLLEKLFDFGIPPAIAVVRNPFDRIVSEYRYQIQHGLDTNVSFDQFVNNSLGEFWKNKYVYDNHIRPQVEFICAETTIFRFEEDGVSQARKYMADFLGLSSDRNMEKKNVSKKMDFSISPETIQLINGFYEKDFVLLGYPKVSESKKERKHSSLRSSSKPATDLQTSAIIRQKVVSDIAAVSEEDKARMAASFEASVSSGIEENLRQHSAENAEVKQMLDRIRTDVESTGKNLAAELNRLYSAIDSRGLTIEGVREILGRVVTIVGEGFHGQHEAQTVLVEQMTASMSGVAEKILSLDKNLGELGQSIYEGMKIERDLFSDSLAKNEQSRISGGKQNVAEAVGKVVSEISSCIESQGTYFSNSVDVLRESIKVGIHDNVGQLEQKIAGLELGLNEATGKVIGELHSSIETQKTQLSKSVDVLRTGFRLGLQDNVGQLEQKLSGIERGLDETTGRVIGELRSSIVSQKSQLSESFDVLSESFGVHLSDKTKSLDEKLLAIERDLVQFKLDEEASRQETEREVVEQFKGLIEIQQKEIQELDERLVASDSQLMKSRSNERYLNKRLEDVLAIDAKNNNQLAALTAGAGNLEGEKIKLAEEVSSVRRTMNEMQKSFSLMTSSWENEREALSFKSKSLEHALGELQYTLAVNTSTWGQERTALMQEVDSRTRTIEEMEQRERDLRAELFETVDRFHAEINYRESIKERISFLEVDLENVRQQNRELLSSTSFRVTRPLRVLFGALRLRSSTKRLSRGKLRLEDLRKDTSTSPAVASVDDEVRTEYSHLQIAIVVENLDRGGLEQVVLDHARYFSSHCRSLELFVINETGQVYEQALKFGINVFCARDQKAALEKHLEEKHFDFTFFHHSYGYLPVFRSHTNQLVEVIHNEYSWQQDIDFFETIRAQAVDKFVAVSDPVRDYSISNLAIKAESITTVVNGLNIEGLVRPPMEVLHERRDQALKISPTFVMCANGQAQKNHVLVIRAFARLLKKYPLARLQLAGNLSVDEAVEKEIEAELDRCGRPENIELMGSLNRREVSRLLANAHVALLPTKYEGFSIATLEYLYFGLPMILSNTGGAGYISTTYENIIVDEKIGRAVGPPTASEVKSLAGNMARILREYPSYCEKSELAARSYLNYTVDAVCSSYLQLDDRVGD